MLRLVRFNSISAIKHQLVNGEVPITKSLIENALKNNEFHQLKSVLKDNSQLLTPPIRNELVDVLPHDFSIYYLLKDQNHEWTSEQLASLIKTNPERVDTSWELFLRHQETVKNPQISDLVYTALIEKLMVEPPSDSDWAKILSIYTKLNDASEIQQLVFDKLCETNSPNLLFFEFPKEFLLKNMTTLSESQYSIVFQKLFQSDPSSLEFELYVKALNSFKPVSINKEFVTIFKQLTGKQLNTTEVTLQGILDYIEENKMDVNNKVPQSLLLRLKIFEIYGMQMNDFEKLLQKYHQYQIHSDFGMEIIQNLLIQCYCWKTFAESDKNLLPIIDALMQEEIPIKVLQNLILANSAFGTEKCLDIYNKYINHVSNKPNEFTNRSAAGLLNESIMLAFLYNRDREFASLMFDKIVSTKALADHELEVLKKLFKVYGDAFEQDSWETAQPKLAEYISEQMKRM